MKTGCQLRFVQTSTDTTSTRRVAQIYKQSDGSPESVIPLLSRLQSLLRATNTGRGPECTASQLQFLDRLETMQHYLGRMDQSGLHATTPRDVLDTAQIAQLSQPQFLLGHSIENSCAGIRGDEEYLYVVEVPEDFGGLFNDGIDWRVRVSEHEAFPRWEENTEHAFELAQWEFDGILREALDRYCFEQEETMLVG